MSRILNQLLYPKSYTYDLSLSYWFIFLWQIHVLNMIITVHLQYSDMLVYDYGLTKQIHMHRITIYIYERKYHMLAYNY